MGKRLDALLGRTFEASKFKTLINLAISRLSVLKNQRQIQASQARSDVIKLLQLGQQERALIRVERVIKERNMFDVFVMIEGYCDLLIERVSLIEKERVCPDELKEAISSLIYAASRCGDFPELQKIRKMFRSRYGKQVAARAIGLHSNCGVNPKMIRGLSTRFPCLENRMRVLKEIASGNNIALQLEETSSVPEEKDEQSRPNPDRSADTGNFGRGDKLEMSEEIEKDDFLSVTMRARRKYRDAADAAQEAFETATHAAVAAKAAWDLCRAKPQGPSNPDGGKNTRGQVLENDESSKFEPESRDRQICNELKSALVDASLNLAEKENFDLLSQDPPVKCLSESQDKLSSFAVTAETLEPGKDPGNKVGSI